MEQRRIGRARRDAVAVDAVARHLSGQALRERNDGALAARIERLAHAADAPCVACHGNDLASRIALDHVRQEAMNHAHRTDVIDRDHLVPEIWRVLQERPDALPSCDACDHIDAIRRTRLCGVHELIDRLAIGQIERNELRLPARRDDLLDGFPPALLVDVPAKHARAGMLANSFAVARPMPEAQPVTTTVLPVRSVTCRQLDVLILGSVIRSSSALIDHFAGCPRSPRRSLLPPARSS